ncbi:MarR family winged helix-turn-helix transcriptional regulator [Pigmentiphaga sp. GD03639]|uniref:HTH marR-type domain-containing protein n=1 Tax=Pigmentiphaga daeguensis TaxID=414049 RepID=A0ABN1CHF0_9BURK|nr:MULTISPECIES: MarR family winged helix-turn-helix transcriptional regulator [unclassified Pigmentiphaga]MDH2237246.1 MarR family winged helix-turn-helix transcriptional regulator [Pigmentiphaga sp. GD03639]OVZ61086.1 hypothetical protein CDO46_20595 [Pigmentiphaga sp. NML030171]
MPKKTPPDPTVPLEHRIAYQALMIATRISQFLAPMWEEKYGLTTITWRVMAVVGRFGPLSAKEVAEHTSTDAFFVSRAIVQLTRQGYMTKGVDPRDRRRSVLQLTEAGERARMDVERVMSALEHDVLGAMGQGEERHIRETLSKLAATASDRLKSPRTWKDFAD